MKLSRLLEEKFTLALTQLKSQTLPIKTAYALKGINKAIEAELAKYEELRTELLVRHSSKDDKGEPLIEDNKFVLEGEGKAQFLKDFTELVNMDVNIGTLTLADLGDKAELSADALTELDGLIN